MRPGIINDVTSLADTISETGVRTHAHRPPLRRFIQNAAVTGSMAETDRRNSDSGGVPRIVQTPDTLGGDPRIEGTRIGVAHVYQRYVEGDDTPEEIATGYDTSVAAVHAALAYAFANPEEMEAIRAAERQTREDTETLTPE
jgi:uncharacterized protein (DUF433 family)